MQHAYNIQYRYFFNKYLKPSFWRLVVRYDIYVLLGGKGLRGKML
jgi:hypothetical protein